MANEQNLRPIKKGELSKEELKKRQSNGGKKSGQVRRERKLLRETITDMLKTGDTQDNIVAALLAKAMQGDTKAFEVIRDSIGEKMAENVNLQGDLGLAIQVDYGDGDETSQSST